MKESTIVDKKNVTRAQVKKPTGLDKNTINDNSIQSSHWQVGYGSAAYLSIISAVTSKDPIGSVLPSSLSISKKNPEADEVKNQMCIILFPHTPIIIS